MLPTVPESLLSHYRSAKLAVPALGAFAGMLPDGTQAVDPEDSMSRKMVGSILLLYRELQEIDSAWPATNEGIDLAFASVSQCDSFDGPWRGRFSNVHSAIRSWCNTSAHRWRSFEGAVELYGKTIQDLIMRHYCLESRGEPSLLSTCPRFCEDAAINALELEIVAATEDTERGRMQRALRPPPVAAQRRSGGRHHASGCLESGRVSLDATREKGVFR